MAYSRYLLSGSTEVQFVAATRFGGFGLVQRNLAILLALGYEDIWSSRRWRRCRRVGLAFVLGLIHLDGLLLSRWRLRVMVNRQQVAPIYLLAGFRNLESSDALKRIRSITGAKFVMFVHDLDPLLKPELFPPGQQTLCARRMTNVASFADAVIVPSGTVAKQLALFYGQKHRTPPIFVNHLAGGLKPNGPLDRGQLAKAPYFVCIGTVEPRKNQEMLLDVWRTLADRMGRHTPSLVLVGQRGWDEKYSNVIVSAVATLGHNLVEWRSSTTDETLRRLLSGAQALLMPTLAEGFGIPLIEAIDCKVPAIVSDLEVLREVGGDIPEYLDATQPRDWEDAVVAYCQNPSPRRVARLSRLHETQPSNWRPHFKLLDRILADVTKSPDDRESTAAGRHTA